MKYTTAEDNIKISSPFLQGRIKPQVLGKYRPVVTPVLRPDDVDLVVPQVPGLLQHTLLTSRVHPGVGKQSINQSINQIFFVSSK